MDLEDAVAADAKETARAALADALDPSRPVVVRINAAATPWHEDDVRLCRSAGVGAVMLPKAESVEQLRALSDALGASLVLLPLIETARGLWNAAAIAQTHGVQRLVFGALDFQLDLGLIGAGREELAPYRAQLALASRVAGVLQPVDAPSTSVDDASVVRAETLDARRAGFAAKLCIHPRQIPWVHQAFAPDAAEVAWAQRVLEAAGKAGGGAVAVDGKMVDRPVLALARQILYLRGDRN